MFRFSVIALLVFVTAGCATSPETKQAIWESGRIVRPGVEDGLCMHRRISMVGDRCFKDDGKKTAAIVYLHGCAGFDLPNQAQIDMLAKLGLPIFAPSSFGRPHRRAQCGGGNMTARMAMRAEEAQIAAERVKEIPWVDPGKVVLAGFSEGGFGVAAYGGDAYAAHIILGADCKHGLHAPADKPILFIAGEYDHGLSCSSWNADFEAHYVKSGHTVSDDPRTYGIIEDFLKKHGIVAGG
ncbi:MAG: hypothetical protein JJ855_14115 [Rhodospirillales bacterium]|nr:hypothetical protein [Rhodospirillales bacterium]